MAELIFSVFFICYVVAFDVIGELHCLFVLMFALFMVIFDLFLISHSSLANAYDTTKKLVYKKRVILIKMKNILTS